MHRRATRSVAMPIIDVLMVGPCGPRGEDELAPPLADALGRVLGAAAGRVWVRVHLLPAARYAENATAVPVQPVFVQVLHHELPDAGELQRQARALADTVAAVLQRPVESVHVEYQPPGRGRVAFGGKLLR